MQKYTNTAWVVLQNLRAELLPLTSDDVTTATERADALMHGQIKRKYIYTGNV